jgi:hypothetical protein
MANEILNLLKNQQGMQWCQRGSFSFDFKVLLLLSISSPVLLLLSHVAWACVVPSARIHHCALRIHHILLHFYQLRIDHLLEHVAWAFCVTFPWLCINSSLNCSSVSLELRTPSFSDDWDYSQTTTWNSLPNTQSAWLRTLSLDTKHIPTTLSWNFR